MGFATRRWPIALPSRAVAGQTDITRLMAAVYADMAGYSRLFALDDTGTVARLRALHQELVEPAIRRHHGRLVQTAGDSMLIIFESVAQAVRCAVSIQSETASNGNSWPHDRRMRFRIGVDLGDIIMDGMNFHGDGVIVATRLQAVCPPGGVCVSRAVHERGGERLGLPTQALGPLALKNVTRPVEAYVLWPPEHDTLKLLG
jgi:adenylate cyclase